MVFGAITGWLFFEVLQRVEAEEIKRKLSLTILTAFLSLGLVGVDYFIGGLFDWENSLYAERIPLKLFLSSIIQIVPLFAILFLSKKMDKANMLHSDLGGVMSALMLAFFIVAILGCGGLIISGWWFITT